MAIADFRLERYFARWEFSARFLLSASDCETMTVGELLALAGEPAETLLDLRLGYTESQGDPLLRERIAAQTGVSAAEVVTAVPEEALGPRASGVGRRASGVGRRGPCAPPASGLRRLRPRGSARRNFPGRAPMTEHESKPRQA